MVFCFSLSWYNGLPQQPSTSGEKLWGCRCCCFVGNIRNWAGRFTTVCLYFWKRYKMLKMKRTLSLSSLGQTRLSDMIKEMNLNSRNMYAVSRLTWEQSYHQYPDPLSTGCVLCTEMEKNKISIHANFTPLHHRSNEMIICIKTFTWGHDY